MFRLILVASLGVSALGLHAQPFNQFLSLDGSADYADFTSATGLLPAGSDFTVEGWVRACGTTESVIIDAREGDAGPGLEIRMGSDHRLQVIVQGPSGVVDTVADYVLNPSYFHHFAFQHRAPNQNELHIDGRTFLTFLQDFTPDEAFFVGRADDVADRFFDGYLDELRVSSTIRYGTGFNPQGPFSDDAFTLALWHFEDAPGSPAFLDASSFGNDLASNASATARAPFSVSGGGQICDGASVPLTVSGGDSFSWSPAAGLDDPFTENPVASPDATTYYTVTATDRNSCENLGIVAVVVREEPEAIASSAMPEICDGDRTQLFAEGGVSYLWDFGSVAQNPIVEPTETTTYGVTVTDAFGCTGSAQVTVAVRACEGSSGLADAGSISLVAGPNPTWGPLNVQVALADGADVGLQVVDALGRTLYNEALGTLPAGLHRRTVDAGLAPGSYWLLIDAGTERESLPFVVSF
jgi:hypothetical protein